MPERLRIFRVAVPSPLYRLFDYRAPPGDTRIAPGVRVRVPFGRREVVGVLVETTRGSELPRSRLKPVRAILDMRPVLPRDVLELGLWSAEYYRHPPGEVFQAMMPKALRQGRAVPVETATVWRLSQLGRATDPASLRRAPRQAALLALLQQRGAPLDADALRDTGSGWQQAIRHLENRALIERVQEHSHAAGTLPPPEAGPDLNPAQLAAAVAIGQSLNEYRPWLLDGVTGSGKTEVYLRVMREMLKQGRQVLTLVPEIGLTPQLVDRLTRRLAVPIAVYHSGLRDSERFRTWAAAARGEARLIIGTRSAVFLPMPELGLIVVDEEHDSSLKQQEGFRYSARDLALVRARQRRIPVVLGSATPSLESLYNVERGRYHRLCLPERAGEGRHPQMTLLDIRRRPLFEGLSEPLIATIRRHLDAGGQALIFLNRRGYAPALICHSCGHVAECRRCDSRMTLHKRRERLVCHHCGADRPVPEVCEVCASADLKPMGQGTERVELALAENFPGTGIVRMDRDSTRGRGQIERQIDRIRSGAARLLVGTQMLAKGHDFPAVTLVGIVNADQGLFGIDFRAPERLAQLIMQVAGRAGRADRGGEVVIQTRHPDNPLLRRLVTSGYPAFAAAALAERRSADLPPFSAQALLRAEAPAAEIPLRFLAEARNLLRTNSPSGIEILGPAPAPMERRGGRFRAQLLLQAGQRSTLQRVLAHAVPLLASLRLARRVRWSLDVDPIELD